jgi:hypothetical protein
MRCNKNSSACNNTIDNEQYPKGEQGIGNRYDAEEEYLLPISFEHTIKDYM